MPGINDLGTPNTNDYNLGRGVVYFALLDTDGTPLGYRDLGNAPEFNISVESETLEHQSSREGLKKTDKEVVISQKVNLSLTLDEINFQNLALLFAGETAAHTNVAVAGFSEHAMIASLVKGQWYDIVNSSGERAYDISADDLTVKIDGGATLTKDTDYTVDEKMGRLFFLSGSGNTSDTDTIDVTLAANAQAGDVDEVQALTKTAVQGALKFVGKNPAASDHQTEYQFHQVSLKAEGDFSLIGDEFTTMGFTAVAEANENADAASPTLTIRTVPVSA